MLTAPFLGDAATLLVHDLYWLDLIVYQTCFFLTQYDCWVTIRHSMQIFNRYLNGLLGQLSGEIRRQKGLCGDNMVLRAHRCQLHHVCLGAQTPMGKIMWVLNTHRNLPVLQFSPLKCLGFMWGCNYFVNCTKIALTISTFQPKMLFGSWAPPRPARGA